MQTKNKFTSKNTTKKRFEPIDNTQTVGADGSIYKCMRTAPETGEPNLIVKVIHPDSSTKVFFMSQKGIPLSPGAEKIWRHCFGWDPKPTVEKLPFGLLKAAEAIVEKIKYAMIHKLPVGEYVFPKDINQIKKVKKDLKDIKKENLKALRSLGIVPKITVNTNAGSPRTKYTKVTFEEVVHTSKSKRKVT